MLVYNSFSFFSLSYSIKYTKFWKVKKHKIVEVNISFKQFYSSYIHTYVYWDILLERLQKKCSISASVLPKISHVCYITTLYCINKVYYLLTIINTFNTSKYFFSRSACNVIFTVLYRA